MFRESERGKDKPGLFDGLYELRLEGTLCDVEIICKGGAIVRAHAVVLSGVANYFRALFAGPWNDVRKTERCLLDESDAVTVEFALAVRNHHLILSSKRAGNRCLRGFPSSTHLSSIEVSLP